MGRSSGSGSVDEVRSLQSRDLSLSPLSFSLSPVPLSPLPDLLFRQHTAHDVSYRTDLYMIIIKHRLLHPIRPWHIVPNLQRDIPRPRPVRRHLLTKHLQLINLLLRQKHYSSRGLVYRALRLFFNHSDLDVSITLFSNFLYASRYHSPVSPL